MGMGRNVEMLVKGSILTITVNLAKSQGKSASGKSEIIATTGGNQQIGSLGKTADGIAVGLNIYRKVEAAG